MSLIQTCKCEECDMKKSFANHWVMLYERNGNLVILPNWDEKMIRRTRHFCGRAHASRYVERWISNPSMALVSAGIGGAALQMWLRLPRSKKIKEISFPCRFCRYGFNGKETHLTRYRVYRNSAG